MRCLSASSREMGAGPMYVIWRSDLAAARSCSPRRTAPGSAIPSLRAGSISWSKAHRSDGASTAPSRLQLRHEGAAPSLPGLSGACPRMTITRVSYPAEPVEPALRPVRARERVGDLDGRDPFRVLEAELRRGAQTQRESEGIGDGLSRIFGGEDRLGMERRRHVEAFSVVIGAFECDVFGSEIGADALEKSRGNSPPTTGRYSPNLPRKCAG